MVEVEYGTVIAQFLNFFILVAILAKFAYKPILNLMAERKARIANDLDQAAQAKEEAHRMRSEYQAQLQSARKEAQEIVEQAVQEAKSISAQELSALRQQLQAERDKARREIEEEREQAMKSLREDIISLSVAMAGKVIERDMDSAADTKLIDEAIKRMSSKTMGL